VSKLGKQVTLAVATSPITVPGTIFAAVAGSLAFLSIHAYRGAKVLGNVYGSIKQLETGEEYIPFQFGPNLVEPGVSTFNNYSKFIKYLTDIDLGQQEGGTYKPHPLDPTYDSDPNVVLKKGLMQAENVVIDFINSGGMTYNIALTSTDSPKLYLKTRRKTLEDIGNDMAKPPSSITFTAPTVNPALEAAKTALSEFKNHLDHKMTENIDIEPDRYLDYFQTLHTNITTEVKKQFETDNAAITTACGSDDDLKEGMLAKLSESHSKQLEELNKKFAEDKVRLQDAANQESNRIFFLAQVLKQNPHLKDVFEDLSKKAAAQRIPTGPHAVTTATVSTDPATISFAGIDPKDLLEKHSIKAFRADIKYDAKKEECSMTLPWFSRGFGLEDKNKHRIVMLVKAIKATSGGEKIKLTVDHKDPEYALYLARKMYEACREEGYKEGYKKKEGSEEKEYDYITIVCNGKTIPIFDSDKKQDKEGKEIPGEKGLLRSKADEQAITNRADAYMEQRTVNFKKLKEDIILDRKAVGKGLEQEIKDELATRAAVSPKP
jgi:hypothetical protein